MNAIVTAHTTIDATATRVAASILAVAAAWNRWDPKHAKASDQIASLDVRTLSIVQRICRDPATKGKGASKQTGWQALCSAKGRIGDFPDTTATVAIPVSVDGVFLANRAVTVAETRIVQAYLIAKEVRDTLGK